MFTTYKAETDSCTAAADRWYKALLSLREDLSDKVFEKIDQEKRTNIRDVIGEIYRLTGCKGPPASKTASSTGIATRLAEGESFTLSDAKSTDDRLNFTVDASVSPPTQKSKEDAEPGSSRTATTEDTGKKIDGNEAENKGGIFCGKGHRIVCPECDCKDVDMAEKESGSKQEDTCCSSESPCHATADEDYDIVNKEEVKDAGQPGGVETDRESADAVGETHDSNSNETPTNKWLRGVLRDNENKEDEQDEKVEPMDTTDETVTQIQREVSVTQIDLDISKEKDETKELQIAFAELHKKHEQDMLAMNQRVCEMSEEIQGLHSERQRLLDQLSKDMNNKVGSNEEDLENISRTNRPMRLVEEYQTFCSGAWLDVKDCLDESFDDVPGHIKSYLLRTLMMEIYGACVKIKQDRVHKKLEQVREVLQIQDQANPILRNIESQLMIHLRDTATTLTPQEQELITTTCWQGTLKAMTIHGFHKMDSRIQSMKEMVNYINGLSNLCWSMVTQVPPMTFRLEGEGQPWQGEDLQEVAWGSGEPTAPNHVVLFYVNPPLAHGSHLLSKGKVFCGHKEFMRRN